MNMADGKKISYQFLLIFFTILKVTSDDNRDEYEQVNTKKKKK